MSNKSIALKNDVRLLQLASYIESNGLIKRLDDVEGGEKVFNRFRYLKGIIKNGTFNSISELEDSVYKIYGIVENNVDSDKESDIISQMIEQADKDLEEFEKGDGNAN